MDNRLDGAVVLFLDIDVLKRALLTAERSLDYAQRIVETVPMSLVVVGGDLRIVSANPTFCQTFAVSPGMTERAGALRDRSGRLRCARTS